MSLVANLLTRARALQASATSDSSWIDRLLAEAQNLPADGTPMIVRDLAVAAVRDHRDELARVGAEGFAEIVWHLALGREQGARLVYLATTATPEEREAALDVAFQGTRAAAKRWEERRSVFLAIVRGFGAAALPLILGAL